MASSAATKTKDTLVITHRQKFEGHTSLVWGVLPLPGREQIITCSADGSLRVWNLKSGKQIGEDWRDGEDMESSIALSPDGKKVVSGGSEDGAVKLWDIDSGKLIGRWTGHTQAVESVCWSRDGRRVLTGAEDGTARQWDVGMGETILAPIETGHTYVEAVVYSPDMTMFATGGHTDDDESSTKEHSEPVKIWDAKTGKLVATLKGHTQAVLCLTWILDGKTLISGSDDHSFRTWDVETWEQLRVTVLDEPTSYEWAIAISPNGRIIVSTSSDKTAQLWNLENGQPIGLPLQHAITVVCVSFSVDGKLLATSCDDHIAYTWDVTAIIKEAGLDDLLSTNADKSALHANATRRPVQQRPPAYQAPQGFFDGVPPGRSHSSPQNRLRSEAPLRGTLLGRLFHHSVSDAHDTSPSSPLDWARNLLKRRGQIGEEIELHGGHSAVVEVPYAKGKRRNASAREVAAAKQKQKTKPLHSTNSTAGSSQLPKPNVAQPSSQLHAADSLSSTTPAVGDATTAMTSTTSRPYATIRHGGLWTRFWLFIGCLSPEYVDDHH